ncbi:MAG: hypothetical protein JWS11_491 [Cypionkella sp.]|nr:hypothetical protein [Cypionkella sp.]
MQGREVSAGKGRRHSREEEEGVPPIFATREELVAWVVWRNAREEVGTAPSSPAREEVGRWIKAAATLGRR